jgi:hypothetical protein
MSGLGETTVPTAAKWTPTSAHWGSTQGHPVSKSLLNCPVKWSDHRAVQVFLPQLGLWAPRCTTVPKESTELPTWGGQVH